MGDKLPEVVIGREMATISLNAEGTIDIKHTYTIDKKRLIELVLTSPMNLKCMILHEIELYKEILKIPYDIFDRPWPKLSISSLEQLIGAGVLTEKDFTAAQLKIIKEIRS